MSSKQHEPSLQIRDVNGRWYWTNSREWAVRIAEMQRLLLESNHRTKGTPLRQLLQMASDLPAVFPMANTEVVSQVMGFLYVGIAQFLLSHD
jgi:hypothetical protein